MLTFSRRNIMLKYNFPRRNRRNNGTTFLHSIYMSACNLYFRVFPVFCGKSVFISHAERLFNLLPTQKSQKFIELFEFFLVFFMFMNIGGTRQSQNKFCFALVCTMFLCGIVFFELSCAEIILPR